MSSEVVTFAAVAGELGVRIADADHLIRAALTEYDAAWDDHTRRATADHQRKLSAVHGCYLNALIHDQIYRMYGGED